VGQTTVFNKSRHLKLVLHITPL